MPGATMPNATGGVTVVPYAGAGAPVFITGGDIGSYGLIGGLNGDVPSVGLQTRSYYIDHPVYSDHELATLPFSEVADPSKAFQRFAPDLQRPDATNRTDQEPPVGERDYVGEALVAMTRGETPLADAFANLQAGGEMDPGIMGMIRGIAEMDVEAIFRDPEGLAESLGRLSGRLRSIEESDPTGRPFLSEEVSGALAGIDWGKLSNPSGQVVFRALDELGASFLFLDTKMNFEKGAHTEARLGALRMYQVLSYDFQNWDHPQPERVMAIAHLLRDVFEPLGLTEVPYPEMNSDLLPISAVGLEFMLTERDRSLEWYQNLSTERQRLWQKEDEHGLIEVWALDELAVRTAHYYGIAPDYKLMNIVAETPASAIGRESGTQILESYGKAMESQAFRYAAVLGRGLTQLHSLYDPDYVLMRTAAIAELGVISASWPPQVVSQVPKEAAGIIFSALGEGSLNFMDLVTAHNFVHHVFGSVADRLPDGDESRAVLMNLIERFKTPGASGN